MSPSRRCPSPDPLPVRLWHYLVGGACAALAAALVLASLDMAQVPGQDRTWRLPFVLAGTLLPAVLIAGVGSLLLLLGAQLVGAWLARRLGRGEGLGLSAALTGLLAFPILLLLIQRLALGRQAARMLGALPRQLLLACAGAALAAAIVWVGLRLARLLASHARRLLWAAAGSVLIAGAIALFFVDANAYRRLYDQLHLVLFAAYLVVAVLGMLCFWHLAAWSPSSCPRRLLIGAGACGLLVLVALGWWSRVTLAQDQRLRFSALEQTTVTVKVLELLPLQIKNEVPLFLETSAVGRTSLLRGSHHVPDANVVLVSIDALRADHLGVYGYPRATSPNIDALAARAIRFVNGYCQAPLTCYSVPSLLTGDYLRSTLPLTAQVPPTLAQILATRGYTTAAFYNSSIFFCDDKQAMSYGDQRFGFSYAETELRSADDLTDRILGYLQNFRERGKRKLFLWAHYFDVHEPYARKPEHDFGPREVDGYDSALATVDSAIGRLIAALPQLEGPTIFVLTSDHGEEFKEHGGSYHGSSLYEEQIHVPLIIGVPGLPPGVVPTPAQLVDVVPTVLSLLGLRIPESVHGDTLVPELLGKGAAERAAFAEVHTKKMVRYRDWKLIHDYRQSTFELYDLRHDPQERGNLIAQRPREAERLKELLNGWFDKLRALAARGAGDRPAGIDLGRIGDRRSVPLLARLLTDTQAASRWRQEAARLLGQLQDASAADALWSAVADDDPLVADEAAIALGEVKNRLARLVLPFVLTSSDTDVRMRAGIALARVDSTEAMPALIEALYSDNWEIQHRASHYLGFVGDKHVLGPLLRISNQRHLRSRIALTLGRIGGRTKDRTVLPYLLDWLRNDAHAEVRQRALYAIGYLGDRRAIRPLAELLANEPDLPWTPETLTRLKGIGWYSVPGLDFSPQRRGFKEGWGRCFESALLLDEDYLGKTWCAMSAAQATVQFPLRRKPFPARLMVRLRALAPALKNSTLEIVANGHRLSTLRLNGGWQTLRVVTSARLWHQGSNTVRFKLSTPSASSLQGDLVAVDYLVLAGLGRHAEAAAGD